MKHQEIWDDFCEQNNIAKHAVPLFETTPSLEVATHQIGKKINDKCFQEVQRWNY